ncbi:MAG: signal peptidase I [Clostridia bacterium]|nr:signal peptidase I [Clostridia bacterium]
MAKKKEAEQALPTVEHIEQEILRERYDRTYKNTLLSTISVLVIVAAIAILFSMLVAPVVQITGEGMSPTLKSNDILLLLKKNTFNRGDLVAFYYNNKLLVRRVIGLAGENVMIDAEGKVTVDGIPLDEPYIDEKSLGGSDITYPYVVPSGRVFVLGDNRTSATDSRHAIVGCVSTEQILGYAVFRIWPRDGIGPIQ